MSWAENLIWFRKPCWTPSLKYTLGSSDPRHLRTPFISCERYRRRTDYQLIANDSVAMDNPKSRGYGGFKYEAVYGWTLCSFAFVFNYQELTHHERFSSCRAAAMGWCSIFIDWDTEAQGRKGRFYFCESGRNSQTDCSVDWIYRSIYGDC